MNSMNLRFLFFEFEGRIGRGAFWAGMFALFFVQLLILLPIMRNFDPDLVTRPPALWFRNLTLLIDTILAWPSLAIMAKRQQDRDQTPYLAYAAVVMTLLYSILDAFGLLQHAGGYTTLGFMAGLPLMGVMIMVIVELGIRPGTPGPNRFGPPPEGPE